MRDDLIVLDGSAFFVSERSGDIGTRFPSGLFADDVRHLSHWELEIDGTKPDVLTSKNVDYFSARIALAAAGDEPSIAIERDRFVVDGVHEDLRIRNNSRRRPRLRVEISFGADFADVMEAPETSGAVDASTETSIELRRRTVTLRRRQDGFERATLIAFGERCTLWRDRAVFDVDLAPAVEWKTCIDVTPVVGGVEHEPRLRCDSFGSADRTCRPASRNGGGKRRGSTPIRPSCSRSTPAASPTSHRCGSCRTGRRRSFRSPRAASPGTWRCSAATASSPHTRRCPSSRRWLPERCGRSHGAKPPRSTTSATRSQGKSCTSSAEESSSRSARSRTIPTTAPTTRRRCS